MLTEKEPSQTDFNSVEQIVMDVFSRYCPTLIAKTGSVIRELVVRPVSYLYSWAKSSLDKHIEESSVSYLSKSERTENTVADLVASNFFIQRKSGIHARGVITIIVNNAYIHIPSTSLFTVSDVILKTEKRIIAMDSSWKEEENVQYVPIFPYGSGTYMVNLPVVAVEEGKIELSEGTEAEPSFGSSFIQRAWLSSALTGGQDTETDSELMERARYSTAAAGVGTVYGIKKMLDKSPVTVTGINVIGRDNPLIERARNNSKGISTGGYIDCYIKTQDQASIKTFTVSLEYDSTLVDYTHKASLNATDVNDEVIICVNNVRIDGMETVDYEVDYIDSAARLSCGQHPILKVKNLETTSSLSAVVEITYMPGITAAQSFLNNEDNKFIGLDIAVKAAVPVNVGLDCVLKSSDEDEAFIDSIKEVISRYVCSLPVGTKVLNFSDIQAVVKNAYPEVDLRVPCVFSASMMSPGGTINAFYSNTGLLDIANCVELSKWDSAVCFFNLIKSKIRIEVI